MMETTHPAQTFRFKSFVIEQDRCTMKVGTDGVLLGAWAPVDRAQRILDIGTGTGLIAIMLAQRAPAAAVEAVEIDPLACGQARENMGRSPWAGRLQAHPQAIQEYARTKPAPYDLIVSNPPFFSGGTFSGSQDRNAVRHTVKMPHGDLLGAVRSLLGPAGRFCVVLPFMEGLRFRELASDYHLYCTKMTEVVAREGKPVGRLLLMFEQTLRPIGKDRLAIADEAGRWTTAYKDLTGPFYLKA
ncbi:MAG: hypothetical protein RLY31_3247 [Bacteroidota bacterium]|jgi:tRNA1Val (adenine37-N6)-methyltransferase